MALSFRVELQDAIWTDKTRAQRIFYLAGIPNSLIKAVSFMIASCSPKALQNSNLSREEAPVQHFFVLDIRKVDTVRLPGSFPLRVPQRKIRRMPNRVLHAHCVVLEPSTGDWCEGSACFYRYVGRCP